MELGLVETDDLTVEERLAIKRWDALFALSPDNEKFAFKQFTEGKTVTEARIALVKRNKEQAGDSRPVGFWDVVGQRMGEINCSKGEAIRFCAGEYPDLHKKFLEEQRQKSETDAQEFSDEQTSAEPDRDENGRPANWDAAVKLRMKEAECSEGDAIRFCVGRYPDLHRKFLDEQRQKSETDAQEFSDEQTSAEPDRDENGRPANWDESNLYEKGLRVYIGN